MDNQNTCALCGKKDILYYCACDQYFCKYHQHYILHKCITLKVIYNRLDYVCKTNKCYVCGKKILNILASLGIYKCYCGGNFCKIHKNNHHCTFDYKSYGHYKLKNTLKRIVADKVPNRI